MQSQKMALPVHDGKAGVKMLSTGKPIRGTSVRVLDEHLIDLPERVIGELALKSDCMLSGYYHRPDATQKAIRDGWYLTGDFGYRVGDEIFVCGRKKELIIGGGKNIYPINLEELAMQVKGVHAGRVVAFGVFNEDIGTENVILVAEVDTQNPNERQRIEDEIQQTVTRGSAVALQHVHLVGEKWLIKTSSGKNARVQNKEKFLREAGWG